MTRIDFYILEGKQPADGRVIACRVAEKAWLTGHRVYIHTADEREAERLDELLWTFRQGSFVPHQKLEAGIPADTLTPIHIGWGGEPEVHDEVLINLAAEVPLFFSRFQRVAEIVPADEQARQQGRARYKFYRDRGYPLETHTLAQG
ncbi:DNA polymerase III subunit chi [Sulfurivermis fontis]|uniref:DNA polymerase III subunit chi n=1 Tax=Sulfurivermis fontis TaxID=1972068 RepID=UPI000FD8D818|nr:DNA polymerase III subunit chi [Sulfurivermis fontis]